ncbi:MAG: tRNA lysidine(34) synthetase TilS [Alphaproteobacteria bacterium]|nr:tRNA lysidine(34) synthetase TilS [Alphaproteobacteria bacterium]
MAAALHSTEFSSLMAGCGPFEAQPRIAVALSGGSDSMALALLANDWARQHGGEAILLTVDHGLRPEAAAEAAQLASWAAMRGMAHHTLRWQPGALGGGIQEAAREARYGLLSGWCERNHVLHLLTAHHGDDQCETLFFRLARGSGLDGLACMARVSSSGDVRLLRPLLGIGKARLEATLEEAGQDWLEDASNQGVAYTRNRIRHALARDGKALAGQAMQLCDRLGAIRNQLFFHTVSSLSECVSLFPGGFARLDNAAFNALPRELRLRVLAALLPALSNQPHPPRHDALERLSDAIGEGRAATLGGFAFVPKRGHVLALREVSALAGPLPLPPGEDGLWDGRFAMRHTAPMGTLSVRAVGAQGLAQLPRHCRALRLWGRAAISRLPGFWHLESLVAAPHIEYYAQGAQPHDFQAQLCAAKPLAARPFFGLNMPSPHHDQGVTIHRA